ncbi:very short patch repair endonuclease [Actinacidiphila glaucinigra]|uniref:very short patch repair endonuclease n=1 Tax=Actinacidiphila glaucinigra TaxID=235986 RepID=UPI0035DF4798
MQPLTTTPAVSRRMSRQRSRNTGVEVLLRKELHRVGLRFRVHRRPLPGLRREADVVFGPAKVAVFVDGCYWHGCPQHATWPKTNADFWRNKITRNQERDRDTDAKLAEAGWASVRIWEHEDPIIAAQGIAALVRERRQSPRA